MRWIDADAIIRKIENDTCSDCENKELCKMCFWDDAKIVINNMDTVDPVKHGHWEMYKTAYKCSVCEQEDPFGLTPYCRWCGAKMDEEVSG